MNASTVPTFTRDADGRISAQWPDPKPRTVEVSVELLEQMIEQHNRSLGLG